MQVGDLVIHLSDWHGLGYRYCGTVLAVGDSKDPHPFGSIAVLWHSGEDLVPMRHRRNELEVLSAAKRSDQ